MSSESDKSAQLNRIISDYLEAVERGERPDREELQRRHPQLADDLASFFAGHDRMRRVHGEPATRSPAGGVEQATIPPVKTEDGTFARARRGQDGPPNLGTKVHYFGKYELLKEIARGGMGVVYKARQTSLNRVVALKMILSGQLASEEDVKRFRAEAEAAANLDHPGIVPIYEIGEHEGQHYFSMGFVEGESLADRVKDGPLPPRQAAEHLRKIAEAVAFAHANGVIHRDLKPSNVLIDADDRTKVTDFGLAKRIEGERELTATGQILGTPSYMPPEQASGRLDEVTETADVYSLGALLYSLLAGRPPFQAASPMDTLLQVLEREPVPPRVLNPQIPIDLETICLKCLAKQPSRRYASAAELSRELQRFLLDEPIVARRVSRLEKGILWCRRNPKLAILSSLAALAILIVSLAAHEWRCRAKADALVRGLMGAEPGSVMDLVDQLAPFQRWSKRELAELASREPSDRSDRRQLHARIALARHDAAQIPPLLDELLRAAPPYVRPISQSMRRHQEAVSPLLWKVLHSDAESEDRRLRASLALASWEPRSDQWTDLDLQFLAASLIAENPLYQPEHWRLLHGLGDRLLPQLERLFHDQERPEVQQVSVANAIVFFAGNDEDRILRLLLDASELQYEILYERSRAFADAEVRPELLTTVERRAEEDANSRTRIALGKRRAAAAITLLRMGEQESVLNALSFGADPEAATQFVHRCRSRNVAAVELLELLELVDQRRGPLGLHRSKAADAEMFAILLALGEFAWDELPLERDSLVQRLQAIYELDPSSGVHSAAGWLLRSWGHEDLVARIDQTAIPYDETGHREWFVREIEYKPRGLTGLLGKARKLHLTFVVFQPGSFMMGSPASTPRRDSDEALHRVVLSRPVAVCDRELGWAQWMAAEGDGRRNAYAREFSRTIDGDDPVFGVNWFDAVGYCRWLTEQGGFAKEDQCYEDPATLPKDSNDRPQDWPLRVERLGIRLPTEAEWEYVCRSGTATDYSFGGDEELLSFYAWFQGNNGGGSHATCQLRPNPRGLFDMHGNVAEWCHDWYAEQLADAVDPAGAATGNSRVVRGGFGTNFSRSSDRDRGAASFRLTHLGFRVVATLPAARTRKDDIVN